MIHPLAIIFCVLIDTTRCENKATLTIETPNKTYQTLVRFYDPEALDAAKIKSGYLMALEIDPTSDEFDFTVAHKRALYILTQYQVYKLDAKSLKISIFEIDLSQPDSRDEFETWADWLGTLGANEPIPQVPYELPATKNDWQFTGALTTNTIGTSIPRFEGINLEGTLTTENGETLNIHIPVQKNGNEGLKIEVIEVDAFLKLGESGLEIRSDFLVGEGTEKNRLSNWIAKPNDEKPETEEERAAREAREAEEERKRQADEDSGKGQEEMQERQRQQDEDERKRQEAEDERKRQEAEDAKKGQEGEDERKRQEDEDADKNKQPTTGGAPAQVNPSKTGGKLSISKKLGIWVTIAVVILLGIFGSVIFLQKRNSMKK